MRMRERMAFTVGPLPLRLALAFAFVFAGLGKLVPTDQYTGPDAESLMRMNIVGEFGAAPSAPTPKPEAAPEKSGKPAENAAPPPAKEQPKEDEKKEQPPAKPDAEKPAPEQKPPANPDTPEVPPPDQPLPEPGADDEDKDKHAGVPVLLVADTTGAAGEGEEKKAESDEVMRAPRLHQITLLLVRASDHGPDGKPLLPEFVGRGKLPKYLAWTLAVTELLGGLFLFFGLLTRLCGFALSFAMLTAMWLTTIGPAAMGYAPSVLLVLPAIEDYMSMSWQIFLMQMACFGCAASLIFLGAGPLSLDRLIFGPRDLDDPAAVRAARNLASRQKTP